MSLKSEQSAEVSQPYGQCQREVTVTSRIEKEPHSPTTHGRSRNTAIEAEPAGGGP